LEEAGLSEQRPEKYKKKQTIAVVTPMELSQTSVLFLMASQSYQMAGVPQIRVAAKPIG
jgi:hypothetical protein